MKYVMRRGQASPRPAMWKRRLPTPLVFGGLSVVFVGTLLLATSVGSVAIPVLTIVQIILHATGLVHTPQQWDSSLDIIILQVRLPAVMADALVGAALAVAGTLFQGMLRNPLADPYLIGTSSGAALGATIAFVLPFDTVFGSFFSLTPFLAFVGALVSVLLVYMLARSDGKTPVILLLLAGVVMNAVLAALQTLILNLWPSSDFGRVLGLFNWLSGGVAQVGWSTLAVVGVLVAIGLVGACWLAQSLDVLSLGEEGAAHLGIHVEHLKFLIVIFASLLTAAAVSISGLVGFVGLVTPHIMRLVLGPRHRELVPAAALAGAIFLMLADVLARTVLAPAVLPVGIFTALVGAPFFLFLLRNSKREYSW